MKRERLHVITHPERLHASIQGIIVEAHPDDMAMSLVDSSLTRRGIGITIATFTDGAARELSGYTPETLRQERRKESIKAAEILGAAQVFGADLPDGNLINHRTEGSGFLADIVARVNPTFLIAPHPNDVHPDHAVSAEIAKEVAGGEIPLYFMDTISGRENDDTPIIPTHLIPLSRRDVRLRKDAYLAHKSQVANLPPNEFQAVQEVLAMPYRRGREFGLPHAGVLVKSPESAGDPISHLLVDCVIVKQEMV